MRLVLVIKSVICSLLCFPSLAEEINHSILVTHHTMLVIHDKYLNHLQH